MTQPTYKAIVLSETHWDRAWYLPFQIYRVRLVRLIDRLIDLLDSEPSFHSFMLDGQMSVLEDYLEIRPERKTDLIRLVQEGRLFVGPWYILADEFLVSPESLIRNLMLGNRMAKEYGPMMREGYTPDSFGHIAQLPQILRGFDIESCIFWRGFGDEADTLGTEFYWHAPDGTEVLGINLRDGYHNIANVGYPNRGSDRSAMKLDMELAMDQMRAAVDLLKPQAETPYMLLLDGVDHAEANKDITKIIAQANALFDDVEIEHGSLPSYIANVRANIKPNQLQHISGEFNRGKYSHVLQSVYSTRMYLKQANAHAQSLLESYTEPLSAWAWTLGADYPNALIWHAWKKLLLNHPHDDICGCSTDEVHREDMQRFEEVEQLGNTLTRDSARAILPHVDFSQQEGQPFVIFNPNGWDRQETAVIPLTFDLNAPDDPFHLVDADGNILSQQLLGNVEHFDVEVRKNHYQRIADVCVTLDNVPSCGFQVVYATAGAPPEQKTVVHTLENGMENEAVRVTFNADGSFDMVDKINGRSYSNLNHFIDEEDAGDEYDYSPCPNPQKFDTLGVPATIRLVHDGPLQVTYDVTQTLLLPKSLSDDRQTRSDEWVECDIHSTITLRGKNRRVDIRTMVENNAMDHRLRVCFPTNIQTDVVSADGHFDVATRSIVPAHKPDWVQPPVPTGHHRMFVDVADGDAGLAIFDGGLPEYEVMPDDGKNTIAITLLRCVDMLFRDDLLTRPGYAWLPKWTPEAQCLGTHIFEYAVAPHDNDWRDIYQDAHSFQTPLYVRSGTEREGFVPFEAVPTEKKEFGMFKTTELEPIKREGALGGSGSFLSVSNPNMIISAIKRSEDGKMLVVRVVNLGEGEETADIRLYRPIKFAYHLNMNEAIQAKLDPHGNAVTVSARPKQVITIGLQL